MSRRNTWLGLLLLLSLLYSIAGYVQFDDHAMMHKPVDRCRRYHRVSLDTTSMSWRLGWVSEIIDDQSS
jgi:hypothetical protein